MINIETKKRIYQISKSGIEDIEVYMDDISDFIQKLSSVSDSVPFIAAEKCASDSDKIHIRIVWDENILEIINDMYYIDKGVKELACEAVDIWLKDWVKEYCKENGFYTKKINWNPCGHDTKVYRFFMYSDDRIDKLIEYINAIEDDDARDVMIGFALGYKPHEMADFIQRTKGKPKY